MDVKKWVMNFWMTSILISEVNPGRRQATKGRSFQEPVMPACRLFRHLIQYERRERQYTTRSHHHSTLTTYLHNKSRPSGPYNISNTKEENPQACQMGLPTAEPRSLPFAASAVIVTSTLFKNLTASTCVSFFLMGS